MSTERRRGGWPVPTLFGLGLIGVLLLAGEGHCRPATSGEVSALRSELQLTRQNLSEVRDEIVQQRRDMREFWQKRPAFEADLSKVMGEIGMSEKRCEKRFDAEAKERKIIESRMVALEKLSTSAKAYVSLVLAVFLGIVGYLFRQIKVRFSQSD